MKKITVNDMEKLTQKGKILYTLSTDNLNTHQIVYLNFSTSEFYISLCKEYQTYHKKDFSENVSNCTDIELILLEVNDCQKIVLIGLLDKNGKPFLSNNSSGYYIFSDQEFAEDQYFNVFITIQTGTKKLYGGFILGILPDENNDYITHYYTYNIKNFKKILALCVASMRSHLDFLQSCPNSLANSLLKKHPADYTCDLANSTNVGEIDNEQK